MRTDSAGNNNRKEGGSHLIAELRENPEHLSAQRPRPVRNKLPSPVHILLGAVKQCPRSSKAHYQLQCQIKLLARLRNFRLLYP